MRRKSLLLSILFIVLIFGCATMSKHQYYLATSKEFTLTLQQYNDWYKLQPEDVQKKWKEDIDPLFITGDAVLKSWKARLDNGQPTEDLEVQLLQIKSDILNLMIRAGIIKIEDEKEG